MRERRNSPWYETRLPPPPSTRNIFFIKKRGIVPR
jgi:hypothetical protein